MYDDSDAIDNAPVYNRGDIVWVKLSGCWWPGEVKNVEDVPEESLSQFRKTPLVIVKFFDEDSYEYVKNWSHIYPYNCEKKNDFIKKGMVGFRSKSSHMSKFPTDIGTAEEKTHGNPNILSLPEFLPVKKINYDEIFGSPLTKKTKLSSIKKNIGKETLQPLITHRRFLGKDDYKAYICLQYPGKYILCDSDEEEIKKLNREPTKDLNCRFCAFKTKRLEVMILHAKTHMKGSVTTSVKRKSIKSKEVILTDSESESEIIKSSKPRQKKKKELKPKKQNSFSYLLDEWNETDEEELIKKSSKNKDDPVLENDEENDSKENSKNADNSIASPLNKNTEEDIKNCFDFDEEDEDEIMLPSSVGRKIPRVIPEKAKTNISELMEQQSDKKNPNDADKLQDINKKTTVQSCEVNIKPAEGDETIDKAFNELMQETSVPKLDNITQTLKPEQNFHDATTIKYPDKGGTASKGGTSKRKCITSFEDFETGFQKQQLKQQSDVNDKITDTTKRSNEVHDGSCEHSKEPEKNKTEITKSTDSSKTVEAKKVENNDTSLNQELIEDKVIGLELDEKNTCEHGEQEIQVEIKKSSGIKKHLGRKTEQFAMEEDSEHVISCSLNLKQPEEYVEIEPNRRGRSKKVHDKTVLMDNNDTIIQSGNTNLINQEIDRSIKSSNNSDTKTDIFKSKKGKQQNILPEKSTAIEKDIVPKSNDTEMSENKFKDEKTNQEVDKLTQGYIEKNEGRTKRSKNKKRQSEPEIVVRVTENVEVSDKKESSEVLAENSIESNNFDPSSIVEKVKSLEYKAPIIAELSFENREEIAHKVNDLTSTKGRKKKNQTEAIESRSSLELDNKTTITNDEVQGDINNKKQQDEIDASASNKADALNISHVSVLATRQEKFNDESNKCVQQITDKHKQSTSHKNRRRKHTKSDSLQAEKANKELYMDISTSSKENVDDTELEINVNAFSNTPEVKISNPEVTICSNLVENNTESNTDIELESKNKQSIKKGIMDRRLSKSTMLTDDTDKFEVNEMESCDSTSIVKSELIPKSTMMIEQPECHTTNTQQTKDKNGKYKKSPQGDVLDNMPLDSDIVENEGTEINSKKWTSPSRRKKRCQNSDLDSPPTNKTTVIKSVDEYLPKNSDQNVLKSTITGDNFTKEENNMCPSSNGGSQMENNSKAPDQKDLIEEIPSLNVEIKDVQVNNVKENIEMEQCKIINKSNDEVNKEHSEPETISINVQPQMTTIESLNNSVIQTEFIPDEKDGTAKQKAEDMQIKGENKDKNSFLSNDLQGNMSEELNYSEKKVDITTEIGQNITEYKNESNQKDFCESGAMDDLETLNVGNEVNNSEPSAVKSTLELNKNIINVENAETDNQLKSETQEKPCKIGIETKMSTQVLEVENVLKMTEVDSDGIQNYNTSDPINKKDGVNIIDESENVILPYDDNNVKDRKPDSEKNILTKDLNSKENASKDSKEKDEHTSTAYKLSESLEKDKKFDDKNFEEAELILPLKKSKRANDISHLIDYQGGNTNVIAENDGDSSHPEQSDSSGIFKCVPPKKKKIESLNDQLTSDISKVEEISQPPKKKIQKLFQSSQAPEKSHDIPLMSPLAKKKNFLFQQEDYEQEFEAKNIDNGKSNEINKADNSIEAVQKSHSLDMLSSNTEATNDQCNKNGEKNSEDLKKPVELSESVQKPAQFETAENSNFHKKITIEDSSLTSNEIWDVIGISDNTDCNLSDELKKEIELKPLNTSVELLQENNENIVTVEENGNTLLEPSVNQNTFNEHKSEEVNKDNLTIPLEKAENETFNTLEKDCEVQSILEPTIPADIPFLPQSELVPIEGTLTVMSEKDLADAQVEITPDKVISEKKPMTLGAFSMDFSDVNFDSNSKCPKEKKIVSESTLKISGNIEKHPVAHCNKSMYKSELLDILEGNSDSSESDNKYKSAFDGYGKKTAVTDMFDFEDAIPSQIVLSNKIQSDSVLLDSPKLLERLSMAADSSKKIIIQSDLKVSEGISKAIVNKSKSSPIPKPGRKIIIKTSKIGSLTKSSSSGGKPIILSEQIIRPANPPILTKDQTKGVKRQFEDIEDVETAFIIPKIAKKSVEEEVIALTPDKAQKLKQPINKSVKAKILQQTIITSKGEIIQPQTTTTTTTTQSTPLQTDETVFDINSMPIVISDDLLTPESIQNMPVVLSEEVQKIPEKTSGAIIKKAVSSISPKQQIVFKTTQAATGTTVIGKQVKPRILSNTTPTAKVNKPGTALLATIDGKPTKYVLVPSSMSTTLPSGKTLKTVIKKQTPAPSKQQSVPQTSELSTQPVGNKIMIVTNQHGQQHRVVLTPQQQKLLMQAQSGPKVAKTVIKSGIPKNILESTGAGPSGIAPKTALVTQNIISSSNVVSNTSGLLMPMTKNVKTLTQTKKVNSKIGGKPQKTILIKNQLGQTVRRIQGTDDAELDRQVAEQLEAIKARSRQQQATKSQDVINFATRQIPANKISGTRRSFIKKPDVLMKSKTALKSSESTVPALAPISPQPKISQTHLNLSKSSSVTEKSSDTLLQVSVANQSDTKLTKTDTKSDRPLNQLVIQDALGNQTTITEGQILALPSETVDGQPQSYMLVTLDETGNLTPLNNEALMSLDPSLGVGGDINNVVLQVDQGQGIMAAVKQTEMSVNQKKVQVEDILKTEPKKIVQDNIPKILADEQTKELPMSISRDDTSTLTSDPPLGGQQLIVTGDPIATQKFLESLSDGTTDLANILANAEGGSVIIQADGQQILIKTNSSDAQSVIGPGENPEGAGNPVFSSHKPNQDILAAALADTDVFQQTDQSSIPSSSVKSQLSPGGGTSLYPMHVSSVLETSLTLSSPIMTPLEVPSTNSKKIDDQADILSQVPKNVDLPITITDPNISQTVAHQQATGLMELTLPLTDTTSSSDMNSPSSYAYTLPTLDEAVGITQKPFNSSMPLLTDDVTEVEGNRSIKKKHSLIEKDIEEHGSFDSLHLIQDTIDTAKEHNQKSDTFGDINSLPILTEDVVEDSTSSIDSTKVTRSPPKSKEQDIVNEGLCTLGGEMCSSLSEPPPDMFDLGPMTTKEEEISSDISSIPEGTAMSPNSEASGEIPLQPQIVATLNDLKRPNSETENEQDEKRQRFN